MNTDRKRDNKAAGKAGGAAANAEPEEDQVGADGRIILVEKDFADPLIIGFAVEEVKEGEEFKANWKEVEKAVYLNKHFVS